MYKTSSINFEEYPNILTSNNLNINSSFNIWETFNNDSVGQENFLFNFNNKEEDKSISEEYINNNKSLIQTDKKSDNECEKKEILSKYYFSELSFINKIESNNVSCSDLRINNNKNCAHNDSDESVGEIKDLNNLSDNIQKENILLNKKMKTLEVDTKDFIVFSFGEYDKESRKIINETLDDIKNGKIKNFFLDESELPKIPHRKKKNIQRRKDNSDNITKKIKTRFLKTLKNKINEKLKIAGSKKYFKYLPQAFISDLSKVKNNSILNMTYKEILTNNFIKWRKSDLNGINNYLYNKSVLDYLENNKDTFKNLNFNIFNMTYSQLYKEYLESKEFEMEIANLTKIETLKYIKNYIVKANNFFKFFSKNEIECK